MKHLVLAILALCCLSSIGRLLQLGHEDARRAPVAKNTGLQRRPVHLLLVPQTDRFH